MSGKYFTQRLLQGMFSRGITQQAISLKRTPHDYPPVTGTEHWKRKIRTLFRSLDVNGDGYITRKAYEMSAQRVSSYMNLDENKAKEVMEHRVKIWEAYDRGTHSDDHQVSEDEYLSELLAVINTTFREAFLALATYEFDAYDMDGDGFISPKEHEVFFYSWGIPTEHSAGAFKAVDINGDGLISREEFIQAGVDFLFGEDENSPYNIFLGPLANVPLPQ
ncbi:sarcoplasmic calcium-binding protein [Lingula anatina]|uniref:Sarcoplasmic calcium-binding protein n=1 Tax=Lingula anatina TaxID=7574 RepID=A0A1S3HKN0_LINAN|nr:sarcoplasmic calcium-binding protein [Lingula anatina]|eukprot:XP_013386658.1 sarcoplasmic calcium-binding protein [Lingula anatina]